MEIEIGGEELHGEEKILNLNIEVGFIANVNNNFVVVSLPFTCLMTSIESMSTLP